MTVATVATVATVVTVSSNSKYIFCKEKFQPKKNFALPFFHKLCFAKKKAALSSSGRPTYLPVTEVTVATLATVATVATVVTQNTCFTKKSF